MSSAKLGNEDFVLLLSGISDNDRFVKGYTGSDHPIYYKSRYTPPFEQFRELKNLLLLVRDMDDISAENTIAVDLSEWIGHEQEEYLTVMLKFLHDQRDHWRYIFTVGSCGRTEVTRLYIKLKTYLTGCIIEDRTFMGRDELKNYLVTNHHMQRGAAAVFAGLFLSRDFRTERGYEILEGIIAELEHFTGGKRIGMAALRDYLSRGDSLMCLLMGRTINIEEEKHESI